MPCIGFLVFMWCELPNQMMPASSGPTFCQIVKKQDVMWSRNDTRRTKENLDALFRKGKRLCRWGTVAR